MLRLQDGFTSKPGKRPHFQSEGPWGRPGGPLLASATQGQVCLWSLWDRGDVQTRGAWTHRVYPGAGSTAGHRDLLGAAPKVREETGSKSSQCSLRSQMWAASSGSSLLLHLVGEKAAGAGDAPGAGRHTRHGFHLILFQKQVCILFPPT